MPSRPSKADQAEALADLIRHWVSPDPKKTAFSKTFAETYQLNRPISWLNLEVVVHSAQPYPTDRPGQQLSLGLFPAVHPATDYATDYRLHLRGFIRQGSFLGNLQKISASV